MKNDEAIRAYAPQAQCFVLLPCAGVGARAGALDAQGAALPKQYQLLAGKALAQHTIDALGAVRGVAQVLVVLAPDDALGTHLQGCAKAFCGGATRAETVRKGLAHLQEALGASASDWVLVHDAARCLVRAEWMLALMTQCLRLQEGGILAIPVADTLKTADAAQRSSGTLPREGKWLAQTPQMFRIGELAAALDAAGTKVSDEASAMELAGKPVHLVRGHTHNIKVTYPEDFALAEAVLRLR